MNANPTIRHSFWSVVVGGTIYWMTMFCANQASIQKYLSVETISQARRSVNNWFISKIYEQLVNYPFYFSALWFSSIGLIVIYTVNFYTGMILVAHYRSCNPVQTGEIAGSDEILPLYIISQIGHLKGITGFFVAGIFAASLG